MSWFRRLALAGLIVALALAASVTGLGNKFAYDDIPMIVNNAQVHDFHQVAHLFANPYWPRDLGGTLYRPLTIGLFTVEWVLGGGSPLVFHVVSVALYIGVSLAVYALLLRLLPTAPRAAWLAAAVFAVHPVHVEPVANVVGQSELLAALFVVTAVTYYLARRVSQLRWQDIAVLGLLYAAGCLTKEHAVILPALLLAAELTVVAANGVRGGGRWPLAATLAAVGLGYFAARIAVLHGAVGEASTMAFRQATWFTRWWTMLGVVPEWIRLLVWPAHLAALYSPPGTPVRDHIDLVSVIGLVLLISAGVLAIAVRRRLPVAAFGAAWIALVLLPVSNVIVRSGVLLAERTLFLPSVGAVIVIGAVLPLVAARVRAAGPVLMRVAAVGAAAVILAGVVRSASRQRAWYDNEVLFSQMLIDEPLSYAAHFAMADWSFFSGKWGTGEQQAKLALRLYDRDPRVFGRLGVQYFVVGQCPRAEPLLRRALELAAWYGEPRRALAECLKKEHDWEALRSVALAGIAEGGNGAYYRSLLQLTDSANRGATADSTAQAASQSRRGSA